MMGMVKAAFAWARGQTEWLVLLAVAGVGAYLYVQFGQVRADRDAALHAAEVICAGAGADFAASTTQGTDATGRTVTVANPRGAICQRHVAQLAGFKAATVEASAAALAKAMQEHDAKGNTDTAAARSAAEAASAAMLRMEKADAEAERTNVVDYEWFAAFNNVAGLRAPPGTFAGR
jgi:hypothetical protein